jgi:hypothetical protein
MRGEGDGGGKEKKKKDKYERKSGKINGREVGKKCRRGS